VGLLHLPVLDACDYDMYHKTKLQSSGNVSTEKKQILPVFICDKLIVNPRSSGHSIIVGHLLLIIL